MNNDKSKIYSISDLANECGITTRAIRHYEDQGLISPERQGTQRLYHARDKVRLHLILRGKRIGFSLSEIKEIINLYDLPHGEEKQKQLLQEKISERRAKLIQQQNDINSMLQELDTIKSKL
jgi:DNA-binding transcriptional MerR regulator